MEEVILIQKLGDCNYPGQGSQHPIPCISLDVLPSSVTPECPEKPDGDGWGRGMEVEQQEKSAIINRSVPGVVVLRDLHRVCPCTQSPEQPGALSSFCLTPYHCSQGGFAPYLHLPQLPPPPPLLQLPTGASSGAFASPRSCGF